MNCRFIVLLDDIDAGKVLLIQVLQAHAVARQRGDWGMGASELGPSSLRLLIQCHSRKLVFLIQIINVLLIDLPGHHHFGLVGALRSHILLLKLTAK